jgi:5-methylthioadenosine/S-adenosylhomocysteine deaminase
MTVYRAAWVLPIDQPPVRDAVIEVENGVIRSIYPAASLPDPRSRPSTPLGAALSLPKGRDLGNVAVLPGLVNAHTHLELSWLRGRVPPANRFTDWVKTLVGIRRGTEQLITPEVVGPVHEAIRELRASGTVAIGDITNSLAAVRAARRGVP